MRLPTQLVFWLGGVRRRGMSEGAPRGNVAAASIEALEGRRMLAASPRVATAADPIEQPADLTVGERFSGDVAFLTGVATARFTARPSRLPKAVIRWEDGSRTRVTTTVRGPDRLVASVPDSEGHAYTEPGTYGVVVTFRRRERVLGRATEYVRVSETPPDPSPPPPDGRTGDTPFEYQIKAYEAQDREKMPAAGGVLFIGSSSIRQWTTLGRDFPGAAVINRGFGGSEIADSTHYASRIVLPYKPKTIVMYAGENDLDGGSKPSQVAADFKAFVRTVRAALPRTRILFISIKPSPSHLKTIDDQREANGLIEKFTQTDANLGYIDAFHPMLGTDGKPRAELYVKDGQHLSAKGYALWASLVKTFL